MAPSAAQHRASLLQIHLAVLLAGATGLFGKWLALPPAVIVCLRTAFGAVTLAVAAWLAGASLRVRGGKDLLALVLTGLILAGHWLAFFISIQISTVAIGLLGFSTFPLFVTFLEPLIFRERLYRRDVLAALTVVGGLVLVTPAFDVHNHLTQGLLWGILSGLAYALVSLLSRSSVRQYPALTVSFYQQIFAGLFAFPLAWRWLPAITGRELAYLLVLGVIFTGIAQWLLVASLRHLSAQMVSVMLGLEPVYGILLAWVLLGEIPAARTLLGGSIICGTVVWVSWRHARDAAALRASPAT